MVGVAVAKSEVPVRLFERHRLADREYVRDGADEVRFLWRAEPAVLPVWRDGWLEVLPWGCKQRRAKLPFGGWTWLLTLEGGGWANARTELVDVPATYTWAGGVWTRVRHGVRGLLVHGWAGPVVYVVCCPATRYYRVMTGVEFQPVLIGEVI